MSSLATSDEPDVQLTEYVTSQLNERMEDREDFALIEFGPVTIEDNRSAQKALYTFTKSEEEINPGETNKVFRIWTIAGNKTYTIAYVAEPNQYDQF